MAIGETGEPERSEGEPPETGVPKRPDRASGEHAPPQPSKRPFDAVAYAIAFVGIPLVWFLVSYLRKGSVPPDGDCIGAFTDGKLKLVGPAFPWAVIGELSLVVYAYSVAVRRKDLRAVFLGLAVWVGEIVWEMVNGSVRHWYCYPFFGYHGQTAWGLYPGLTIEISLLFALAPLVLFNLLPRNRLARIWGLPSRLVVPFGLGVFCMGVEVLLNRAGGLVWTWWYWRWPHLGLVLFVYATPFLGMAWAYDRVGSIQDVKWRRRTSPLLLVGLTALAVIGHLALPHGEEPVASCPAAATPPDSTPAAGGTADPLAKCSTDGVPR